MEVLTVLLPVCVAVNPTPCSYTMAAMAGTLGNIACRHVMTTAFRSIHWSRFVCTFRGSQFHPCQSRPSSMLQIRC